MYNAMDKLMLEIYGKTTEREVRVMAGVDRTTPRSESIPIIIKEYLNAYHSDYRWMVKFY